MSSAIGLLDLFCLSVDGGKVRAVEQRERKPLAAVYILIVLYLRRRHDAGYWRFVPLVDWFWSGVHQAEAYSRRFRFTLRSKYARNTKKFFPYVYPPLANIEGIILSDAPCSTRCWKLDWFGDHIVVAQGSILRPNLWNISSRL